VPFALHSRFFFERRVFSLVVLLFCTNFILIITVKTNIQIHAYYFISYVALTLGSGFYSISKLKPLKNVESALCDRLGQTYTDVFRAMH
jgi:hypothetical protein